MHLNVSSNHYVFLVGSLEEGIHIGRVLQSNRDVFVIGGASVFEQTLEKKLADRIVASRVKGVHDGDTYFPKLDPAEWTETLLSRHNEFDVFEYRRQT